MFRYMIIVKMSDYVSSALDFCMRKIWQGFIAKQQAYLDMLLHVQQVMPQNGYICDV